MNTWTDKTLTILDTANDPQEIIEAALDNGLIDDTEASELSEYGLADVRAKVLSIVTQR